MVETLKGTDRSAGVSYDEVLDRDSHPVRDILRVDNPLPPGPTIVDPKVYYSREVFEREKERLWKRVWQMACHEDDTPNVGDAIVYDIANLSLIVVRSGEDEFHAFPNACRATGRSLTKRLPSPTTRWRPTRRCLEHWGAPTSSRTSSATSPAPCRPIT